MAHVHPRGDTIVILDDKMHEQVTVSKEELRQLISDLQQHLEWDFNEIASLPPHHHEETD